MFPDASTEDFGYYSCRMSVGNQTVESKVELLQIVSEWKLVSIISYLLQLYLGH